MKPSTAPAKPPAARDTVHGVDGSWERSMVAQRSPWSTVLLTWLILLTHTYTTKFFEACNSVFVILYADVNACMWLDLGREWMDHPIAEAARFDTLMQQP